MLSIKDFPFEIGKVYKFINRSTGNDVVYLVQDLIFHGQQFKIKFTILKGSLSKENGDVFGVGSRMYEHSLPDNSYDEKAIKILLGEA